METQTLNFIIILTFGSISILLITIVLLARKRTWGAISSKLLGFVFIIICILLILFSEIPSERYTQLVGLMGVISGYFFGVNSQDLKDKNNKDKNHTNPKNQKP